VKPGGLTAGKYDCRAFTTATPAKFDILTVTGRTGAYPTVAIATANTLTHARGRLYMAKHARVSGQGNYIQVTPYGLIEDVDTSALAVGDPIYLGTAGQVSTTATGFGRRIGYVVKAATVANGGAIAFEGWTGFTGGNNIVSITDAFQSGQATRTITNPLGNGSGLTGRPLVATLNTADTTNTILSAVWSTNDIVVTRTTGSATTPSFSVFISAF